MSHFPAHMSLCDPYMPIYLIKYLHSVPYLHVNPVAWSLYMCLSSVTSCYPEITSKILFLFLLVYYQRDSYESTAIIMEKMLANFT